MISPVISIGDIVVGLGFFIGMLANYFAMKNAISVLDFKVEELRRGRGLIMREWPALVQRCMGFRNGHRDDG